MTLRFFVAYDINHGFAGMRGKMSKNCLWHACQALFVGLVLFSIGAAMSTLGEWSQNLVSMCINIYV
ncbi:unnamed protein product [Allacma fusca]|uniref:Uncharacterized protein n=1 Tax=Allacma fusca TaxID=39272 RepID=A0A8J2JKM1_9HEXA|nr:unnamed protein product [Allacma fusca]